MESVEIPTMHATDSKTICVALPCARDENDEISKKLEDELLYGAIEDAEEDDAQSDDSLRLRLSDDEVDADDYGTSLSVNNQLNQSEKTESHDMEFDVDTSNDCSMQHHDYSHGIHSITSKNNNFEKELDSTNDHALMENNFCNTAIENASHKDNSSDLEPITTENISLQLNESKLSADTLDTSLNPSDKPLLPHTIQTEPKENGIIDEDKKIEFIKCEVNNSNDLEDNATSKSLDTTNIENISVPINEVTKDDDISKNRTIKNIECQQTIVDDSKSQEIEKSQSSNLEIMVITSCDNLPKNETIMNEEKPTSNPENNLIKIEDEQNFIETNDFEGDSEKLSNNENTIEEKQNDSNSENHTVPDRSPYHDEEKNHIGNKRSRNDSDNEITVSKKIQCEKSTIDEAKLITNGEKEQAPMNEILSTTEKSVELMPIVESNNLNDKNSKSESSEVKTSVLSIDILDDDDENLNKDDDKLEITAVIQSTEMSTKSKRRRRKRRINSSSDVVNSGQEKENVRQKRETAQKAEEIIRKRYLNNDSDSESSDNIQTFVNYNKPNPRNKPSSPPLKRNCPNEPIENNTKKPKKDTGDISSKTIAMQKSSNNNKTLEQVRKFFWRDGKKSLSKFTQEELEELLIQKVIETITMRDEIGKLREQAKISERNQEMTRVKCQQLSKQIKDFEMVLSRFSADRRSGDKNVPPIKINRSVGLQVNFLSDHGVQNLRLLQQNTKSNATIPNGENSPPKQPVESSNNNTNGRKGIKVRSPRRSNDSSPVTPSVSTTSTQIHIPITATVTPPAAVLVPKPTDNHIVIPTTQVVPQQQGTVAVNGAITTTLRQTKVLNTRVNSNNENLIDLTGEEEKIKNIPNLPPLTAITTTSNPPIAPKAQPRYQRVIQPTPPNITITQPALKLVQPGDKPLPATIVNNVGGSRLTFVMHGIGGQRQLLIPSNTTPIRPAVNSNNRAFPITYTGVPTIPNGSVRVVPATTPIAQKNKHPAPLPGVNTYPINAALKLPPPAPALKISKVANGIVLSWNMKISNEYAEIASYQLYAYQEVTGMAPSTSLWKKVGDVRALPLPMACTLTQFSEGNNYYFAVRAVDTHSRFGQYSQPGNISL